MLVGRSHRFGRPLLEPMSGAAGCRPSAANRLAGVLNRPINPWKGRDGANSKGAKTFASVAWGKRRSRRRAIRKEPTVLRTAHKLTGDEASEKTTHPSDFIQNS